MHRPGGILRAPEPRRTKAARGRFTHRRHRIPSHVVLPILGVDLLSEVRCVVVQSGMLWTTTQRRLPTEAARVHATLHRSVQDLANPPRGDQHYAPRLA